MISTKKTGMNEQKKIFLAFQRATLDLEKSFAPDPLKYCDYDYKLDETLKVLIYHLKAGEYQAKKAENFDLPKGEFAIRPGVIVDILDLTVINRLLVDFIFKLDRKLPAGVTAYRLRQDPKLQFRIEREPAYFVLSKYKREKIKIEEPWYNLWPKYRKNLLNDLKSGKYKYVATTDITAYFEDINLITLGEILKKKVGRNLNSINMIIEIFRSWTLRDPANIRQQRGLPQGPIISGVLSNYYLDIVDTYLENEKKRGRIKWYRYCDDIHVLCKSREQAKAILLKIGGMLRQLGLNQSAEKTKLLTSQEAIKEIYNEIAENISSILEDSQKRKADRAVLIDRLRNEYKKISRRKRLDSKIEAALMRMYTAARVLESPLLTNRVGDDFIRFPMRSKSICKYARQFINYKPVLRKLDFQLTNKTHRLLLYNFQLAFLVTAFRNLKKHDRSIFNAIKEVAFDTKRHWYVRTQAITTLFYLGVNLVRTNQVKKLLYQSNHRFIRRQALILIPLCFSPKETIDWLNSVAKDLNTTVSRMANFLLALICSKDFAINHLKKFKGLNNIFLTDQLWRLYFIALNRDENVQKSLRALLRKAKREFYNYPIIKEHLKQLYKIIDVVVEKR